MSLIKWDTNYSVKIKIIDNQHQNLVALINQLYDGVSQGKGSESAGKTLDELINYTRTHFAYEEQLFRIHGYPEYLAHKAEHDALTEKVLDFQSQFRAGKATLALPLLSFLKDWLTNHIQGTDKRYSNFLNTKGVF